MDDRSLKEMLLESADDLEAIVKQILDSLLNREKSSMLRNGESVTNLVILFDSKQKEINKLLNRVPEFQAREKLIEELRECVAQRDKIIQGLELSLKACEVALTRVMFQASQKLKTVRESELRPVNSETLVKLAHQISRSYSVSAPLTWQQGDPSRPFPQEHEFRSGWLLNPKATQPQALTAIGLLRQTSQMIRTPPVVGRPPGTSPALLAGQAAAAAAAAAAHQKIWSPRTGYGLPPSSTIAGSNINGAGGATIVGGQIASTSTSSPLAAHHVRIGGAISGTGSGMATSSNGGMAPNQMNKPGWQPSTASSSTTMGVTSTAPGGAPTSAAASTTAPSFASATVSPFLKNPPVQSPLVSPSVKVKITGLTRIPPPIRNVEQMSSDSSSSSSSDDENAK